MTIHGRGDIRAVARWLERHPIILPIAVLVAAAAFRFYNLNWDDGQQLHPDERWIYMVVSGANGNPPMSWPTSVAQFFDIRKQVGSPLDPHFFAYGSLPFYLLALVAGALSTLGQHVPFLGGWSALDTYGNLPTVGRTLSASLDLLALVLLFFLGRRMYGYWTGLLAMALGAFTVLDIQLSHFYAVDTVLLPLVLLALLAAVDIVQRDRRLAYLWGGAALGAALATKTTALLLVIPLGAAGVLAAWSGAPFPTDGRLVSRVRRHYASVSEQLNRNLQLTLAGFMVAAASFVLFEPYAVLDRGQLLGDLAQQTTYLVTNSPPFEVPFTIQYAHTTPYLYQLQNLLFWCMGIPLGLAAFVGVLWALVRIIGVRVRNDEAVLLLWVVPYFLFVGRFFAKFNRYMLPITPVMTLLGAAFMVWLVFKMRGRWRLLAWAALSAVASVSFLYSLAYMNIYEHTNTRVAASRWIYATIPPGTTIATEGAWDDPLPLGLDGHSGAIYHQAGLDPNQPGLNLYDPDGQHKIDNIANILANAQYIIMSSERMDRSIPRLPDRYPITTRYYRLLFSGRLNFRLVRQFQQHPELGPIVVHDYAADESFHVYDHPNVRIFKRVSSITPAQVAALLKPAAPAVARGVAQTRVDTRLMLDNAQWRSDAGGATLTEMFPPGGFAMRHPIIVWLLALELLGLAAFPFCFLLLSHLVDRGFVISKVLGLLLVGYLIWIAARFGAATYDLALIWLVAGVVALTGIALGFHLRAELAAWIRMSWKPALAGEIVFLAGFVLFILLRMWYPDLGHQFSPVSIHTPTDGRMGEKQMELAFLNAIVRSRVFPPYDPFFAHGYINYYYYGFFLVGTLCKLTQIVPATGFNLAIATFFAMLVGSIFSVVLNLTRRVVPGILAALFVGVIGNLNGAWQLLRGLMSVATVHWSAPFIGGVVDVLSGVQQALFAHQPLPAFDFWESTRIVPPVGGPITEFPYFTYLFADLHPHLMAYPMTAAGLALAVDLLLGSHRTFSRGLVFLLLGALLLGAIAVTNPWDYPTYLGVVGMGALVGAYSVRRTLGWREIARAAGWVCGLAALSFLLYLPFKRDYQTVFTTGIGLVRDITPQMLSSNNVSADQIRDSLMTPLRIYLEHFGLYLFIIASYLVLVLLQDTGLGARLSRLPTLAQFVWYYRERLRRVRHAMALARRIRAPREPFVDGSLLIGFAILLVGLLALHDFLLAFLVGMIGLTILLMFRLARQLGALQLFSLTLILLPLGLSLATQVIFIKDWLAEGPDFRMNTIFKFYNQAWILYAVSAATALYYFAVRQPRSMSEKHFPRRDASTNQVHRGDARGVGQPFVHVADAASPHDGAEQVLPRVRMALPTIAYASTSGSTDRVIQSEDMTGHPGTSGGAVPLRAPGHRLTFLTGWRHAVGRGMALAEQRPIWTLCLVLLVAASLIYSYAGTISRETYRTTWLPEASVPFTLDGMAFMKVAYPNDYAGISWLNAHVRGAQVVAEADDAYYNWRSRVSMFTGLPDIINGIHEAEQRYSDELDPSQLCGASSQPCLTHSRADDVKTLYNSPNPSDAWRIIHTYGVRYIYVGFSERQSFGRMGLAKFSHMVGRGLRIVFHHGDTTIYQVVG